MVDSLAHPAARAPRAIAPATPCVVLGAGDRRRLVACPVSEPGFVVGRVREDGWLTLRRAPGRCRRRSSGRSRGSASPSSAAGEPCPAVVARAIHPSDPGPGHAGEGAFTVDSAYVDIGAATAAEVAAAGVGVLSPVAIAKRPQRYGTDLLAAPVAGRRAACAALVLAARRAIAEQGMVPRGESVVIAFVVEQDLSGRGLATLANTRGPFTETVHASTARAGPAGALTAGAGQRRRGAPAGARRGDALVARACGTRRRRSRRRRSTGADSLRDRARALDRRGDGEVGVALGCWLRRVPRVLAAAGAAALPRSTPCSAPLVETHGVSGMEAPVRETVKRFLPAWARTQTDTAGNLWLTVGQGEPTVVFVAHLDEIGFTVKAIRDDGTLEAEAAGGFFPTLWEGQPALVHTGSGEVPGVFVPHDSTAAPTAPGCRPDRAGGRRHARIARLPRRSGIRVGHTVTSPKRYVHLLGTARHRPLVRRSRRLDGAGAGRATPGPGPPPAHGHLRLERPRGDRPGGRERRRRGPRAPAGTGARHRHLRLRRLAARAAQLRPSRHSGAGRWRARWTTAPSPRPPTSTPWSPSREHDAFRSRSARRTVGTTGRRSVTGACPTCRSAGRFATRIRPPRWWISGTWPRSRSWSAPSRRDGESETWALPAPSLSVCSSGVAHMVQ